ncbi:serine acetyltransferase [Bifidobacterium pullorum subsp. saeculare]|uniref:Serine acetyltransferase n=1 Tax=Bifidobacterium pullorum subsp. saeculare TaxID=78257 RepID=A0A938WXC9_9BIFI|nr:hypothetical protein [Bifidobacterium pullorum]MBM6699646.1 serine acetyltransferase [Bifidobacterium pullorum subsp. saeculare]
MVENNNVNIVTRGDLKRFLDVERTFYIPRNRQKRWYLYLTNDIQVQIWRFQKRLRVGEYWFNNRHRSLFHYLIFLWKYRMKNNAGGRLGISIAENCCDIGLRIYHEGIIINGHARIGKNLHLHGRNCIGNRGMTGVKDEKNWATPVIGDNVEFGMGATAIGGITIADDVTIGAGAVVVKSCSCQGGTLIGVPARLYKS